MTKKEFLLQNKEAVKTMFIDENRTVVEVAEKFNCSTAVLQRFLREQGISKRKQLKLEDLPSKEELQNLIDKGVEYSEICKKYGIISKRQLQNWIKWYNGHREFKERSSAKGEIYMTKGRKTTQEERAKIVAFCIEHNKDYGLTVETYSVSYQQVYAWVRKYEEGGVDKLRDNRGRTKPVEEMTEVEKLKVEMKILEAKNRQLEIENAFIKKLQELKGGGR